MSIYQPQLKELIEETLREIDLYSEDAVNLLLGTAAQESQLGKYIKQLGNGPALGIFQMEPNTFNDIRNNYLGYRPALVGALIHFCNISDWDSAQLVYNLKLAICMARIHYLRVPNALPGNLKGYAKYWKKYYNTPLGAGTEGEFVANYEKYIINNQ